MQEQTLNQEKTIETPQELIDETIDKVKKILDVNIKDYLDFGNGQFTISHGSTQIMIVVRPFTEEDTCVECMSQLVTGSDVNNELTKFLLRKNAELHFGAFGLLFDDTITFSHSITGKNLDSNELLNSLNSVATIADYYDDVIVDMAGGQRALDAVEEDEDEDED